MKAMLQELRNYASINKAMAFAVVGGSGAFIGSLIGQIGGNAGLLRIVFWDACIGLAIGAALSWMQSWYLRRTEVGRKDILQTTKRCALGGAAGGLGLALTKGALGGELPAHIAGWTAEGLIMGWLLAPVFPNLKLRLAIIAGGLAGAIGSILGGVVAPLSGVTVGVAIADALKGVFLGFALTLTEKIQSHADASIVVHWGQNETSTILLGKDPIRLGSDPSCHIYLSKSDGPVPPVVGEISLSNGKIILKDKRNDAVSELSDRAQVEIMNVVIEVRAPNQRRAERRGA